MSLTGMGAFVESHLSALKWSSEFILGFEHGDPISLRFQTLESQGRTQEELKGDLVESLCLSSEEIRLDYWGCYAEAFRCSDPTGSIPDRELFPNRQEQRWLLLLPQHVDTMLTSLEAHRHEVTVMTEADISLLREWRRRCSVDPSFMVAYFFDY
jgi:hypothetical protein